MDGGIGADFPPDVEERPTAAFILSLLAGILILVEGALAWAAGSLASSAGYVSLGGQLAGAGILGGILGFVIVLLAIGMMVNPEAARAFGIAVLALSWFALFAGGGFILGTILGVLGGILGAVFRPSFQELPWDWTHRPARRDRACGFCEAPVPAGAKMCPNCGRDVA
ncbi:MAG: hypothetical protein L3J73_02205 [Thermoplasmata archaeon]|nr:hypothetical protein [Thermoplasmata archaeon]